MCASAEKKALSSVTATVTARTPRVCASYRVPSAVESFQFNSSIRFNSFQSINQSTNQINQIQKFFLLLPHCMPFYVIILCGYFSPFQCHGRGTSRRTSHASSFLSILFARFVLVVRYKTPFIRTIMPERDCIVPLPSTAIQSVRPVRVGTWKLITSQVVRFADQARDPNAAACPVCAVLDPELGNVCAGGASRCVPSKIGLIFSQKQCLLCVFFCLRFCVFLSLYAFYIRMSDWFVCRALF